MYIFISFHIVKNHTKSAIFSSKINMITNVILILYNSSINNKLILRDLRFRKIIPNSFCVSEEHEGVSFLNESTVK